MYEIPALCITVPAFLLRASLHLLAPPIKQVHTITFDNGKEFSGQIDIATRLNAKTYFAKPWHAWERGLDERTNGLIRRYFPKGTRLHYDYSS